MHDGTVGADSYADDVQVADALRAAQDGDESAFRVVYRSVHPRLLAYVRTLVGASEAEDVASEAWLQIARDLGRFRGDADRFRGWAARIARNRAVDHLRRAGRRPVSRGDESELGGIAAPSDTAGEALEALATERALALIARLPQEQAEAVVLRVVMGLEASSAARVLGKRAGAVRTASYRGLRRLAALLADGVPGTLADLAGGRAPGATANPAGGTGGAGGKGPAGGRGGDASGTGDAGGSDGASGSDGAESAEGASRTDVRKDVT